MFGIAVLACALAGGSAREASAKRSLEVCPTCTYTTIQDAVAAASRGDTISVAAGSYPESVEITQPLTLTGPNASVDPVTGSRAAEATVTGTLSVSSSSVSITGLELTNPGGGSSSVAGIQVTDTGSTIRHVTIEHNVFTDIDNAQAGGSYGVLAEGDVDDLSVSGNRFTGIHSAGLAHAIEVTTSCSSTAAPREVVVADNEVSDVVGSGDAGSLGFALDGCDSANVADASQVSFSHNRLLDVGVRNLDTTNTLDATENWWGSAAGPGSYAQVQTAPWCMDAACSTLSDAADLAGLALAGVDIHPTFSAGHTTYTASVESSVSSVEVTATAVPGATATTDGGASLTVGANTITITVTSADGTATQTYTVHVTRPASSPPETTTDADTDADTDATTTTTTTTTDADADADADATTTTGTATTTGTGTGTGATSDPDGDGDTGTPSSGHRPAGTTQTGAPSGSTATAVPTTTEAESEPVNSLQTAAVAPGTRGSVSVRADTEAPATTPVTFALAWTPATFAEPVTVTLAPTAPDAIASTAHASPAGMTKPLAGGFSLGGAVVEVSVTDDSGAAVRSFDAPLVLHVSASEAGEVAAYSEDGSAWTTIPRLTAPDLPVGRRDGYFVNADGSVDVYTRHATYFALLLDTEPPTRPELVAQLTSTGLRLHWTGARDNVGVSEYVVRVNGRNRRVARGAAIVMPPAAGLYTVVAHDAAGNSSRPSAPIAVVRTHTRRPAAAPARIPPWAWTVLAWQQRGRAGPRPEAPARLPVWYWSWKQWRLHKLRIAA